MELANEALEESMVDAVGKEAAARDTNFVSFLPERRRCRSLAA